MAYAISATLLVRERSRVRFSLAAPLFQSFPLLLDVLSAHSHAEQSRAAQTQTRNSSHSDVAALFAGARP